MGNTSFKKLTETVVALSVALGAFVFVGPAPRFGVLCVCAGMAVDVVEVAAGSLACPPQADNITIAAIATRGRVLRIVIRCFNLVIFLSFRALETI